MTIGAQAIPTISSTSSATSSGRGCRDGGERRSASRSARQQAIRRSRRSVRRSGGGSFTNAATRRRTIWRGCSMRTSAVGSTTIGGSTRRLSTRHYGRIDLLLARWADRKCNSLRRHKTRAIHWLRRIARRALSKSLLRRQRSANRRPDRRTTPPPNRGVRTLTHGGAEGAGREASPYPDRPHYKRRRRSQARGCAGRTRP